MPAISSLSSLSGRAGFGLTIAALCLSACDLAIGATPTAEPAIGLGAICDADYAGKQAPVEGYFIYPDELTTGTTLTLILNTAPGGVEPYVHVRVPVGTGPNQVEPPPADASDQDLRVHTVSGEVADMNRRVRVVGTITAADMGDGTTCFVADPTISPAADVNPVP